MEHREALQHVTGMELSAPRGQTLSGTVFAPPTYTEFPSARSLSPYSPAIVVAHNIGNLAI